MKFAMKNKSYLDNCLCVSIYKLECVQWLQNFEKLVTYVYLAFYLFISNKRLVCKHAFLSR